MRKKTKQACPFRKPRHRSEVSTSRKNETVTVYTHQLYPILNRYFWSHGIGFEYGLKCTRKHFLALFISYLCALLIDGNSVKKVHNILSTRRNGSIEKDSLFLAMFYIINLLNRILLYTKRQKLKSSMKKLAEIYDNVGADAMLVKSFKRKLVFMLLIHDMSAYVVLSYSLSAIFLSEEFIVLPTSEFLMLYLRTILTNVAFTYTAFTAYFVSVCFILKESMAALNRKLYHAKEKNLEALFDLHCKISVAIASMKDILGPCLLITSSVILHAMFEDLYGILFKDHGLALHRNPVLNLLDMLAVSIYFFHFVFLCLFGSYVMNAAASLKATAQTLLITFSQLRSLHVISTMKEGIEGFKILNSIVVGKGLILSAVCSLLSYGILLATLDTSRQAVKS